MKTTGNVPVVTVIQTIKPALRLIPVALLLILSQGCVSDYYFAADSNATSGGGTGTGINGGGGNGPSCSTVLTNTTANLRIAFMVDNSGSTYGTSGTDPQYNYRVKTIQSFLATYGAKTNLSYSFGFFSNDAEVWDASSSSFQDISSGGMSAQPFGVSSDLSNGLNAYTGGNFAHQDTHYTDAMAALHQVIATDVAANGSKYGYVVVFMSDGMPNPSQTIPQLKSLVDDLKTVASNGGTGLTFSSVYFGPEASSGSQAAGAIANLQAMVTEGGGQFVDTNVNLNIQISDLITVPGTTCTGATH